MRWFAFLALLLVLTGSSRAAGPDDQYLDIYNEILQADGLRQSGHSAAAAARYLEAQTALQRLKDTYPLWNTAIVSFRLDYLAEQIQALPKPAPAVTAPPAQPATPPPAAAAAQSATEIASLQEQVRSLTTANAQLENKLKEALSIQPAAVSPAAVAKTEEKMVALQKENDLLTVALAQAKTSKTPSAPSAQPDNTASQLAQANQALADLKARSSDEAKAAQTELAQLKDSLADAQKKVADSAAEIESLKSSHPPEDAKDIAAERDKLKEELAARTRDLADAEARRDPSASDLRAQLAEAERQRDELKAKLAAAPTTAPPPTDAQADQLRAQLAEAERQRDELKAQLAAAPAATPAATDTQAEQLRAQLAEVERQRDELKAELAAAPAATPAATDTQVEQLRARLAVLEAKAVPYTAEELAMIKPNPSAALAPLPDRGPVPPAGSKHVVRSMKDLPPGAGALMADAGRAAMQRDYAKAAEKYEEILHQDENNVFVMSFLAQMQYQMGQFDECEKTIARALALDPDDPASLYVKGILRLHQEKLDEALDALSRSAKLSPTNAPTQYYLGNVLAQKGMRYAAETAFRTALKYEPDNADAHYGLAFVYAVEKPPSLELARWHYHRAVELGHDKNKELEKALGPP